MKNAKILLVDDDIDLIGTVKAILETEQYTVITANNKTQGMEKLHSEKPDLAILDVMMDTPKEGFEMAEEIRKDSNFKDLPILILTALDEQTKYFEQTIDWLPINGYIDKPVEPELLLKEVNKALSN
ncbi:MAG: response regulator [Bacteroidota bacterium]